MGCCFFFVSLVFLHFVTCFIAFCLFFLRVEVGMGWTVF